MDRETWAPVQKVRRFERSRPNELWQTDLFSFLLKRQRRRVHLVAYLDDYSRYIVGFGLHASASGAFVRDVFEASIANFGAPEEVLTACYVSFVNRVFRETEGRPIERQIRADPSGCSTCLIRT